jgi:hypothetical protein
MMTATWVVSGQSNRRIQLAVNVVELAPAAFGSEAAVVGSATRGAADDDSDVDIQFWFTGELPSITVREKWIAEIGGSDITVEQDDRSLACRLDELWLECAWVPEAEETLRVERLRSGESPNVKTSSQPHQLRLRSHYGHLDDLASGRPRSQSIPRPSESGSFSTLRIFGDSHIG